MTEDGNGNLSESLAELREALATQGVTLDEASTDVETIVAAAAYLAEFAEPSETRGQAIARIDTQFATTRTNMTRRNWIDDRLIKEYSRVLYKSERKKLGLLEAGEKK